MLACEKQQTWQIMSFSRSDQPVLMRPLAFLASLVFALVTHTPAAAVPLPSSAAAAAVGIALLILVGPLAVVQKC